MFLILLGTYLWMVLQDHVAILFSFLRKFQTLFHGGWTISHSHWLYAKVQISPHPHQYFLPPPHSLFDYNHSSDYHLIVILICISLKTNDAEYLFMCFLAICISYLEECLLSLTGFYCGRLTNQIICLGWRGFQECSALRFIIKRTKSQQTGASWSLKCWERWHGILGI